MNYLKRIFAVGALLLTAVSSFAADFQGKVSLAMDSGKGQTMPLDYSIKGHKLRIDMKAEKHAMATIMDLDKLEMLMLMPEQKMYMVMPIKETVEKAVVAAGKDGEFDGDVQVTGKTDTILGYKCNEIIVKDKKTTTEMWVAEGLGTFGGLGQNGGPFAKMKSAKSAKWEQVLKDKGGFPLRVITRDAKGNQEFKMEATKIEPGKLADSVFLPPADFKKFQMPDLGGLLKGDN